MLPKVRQFSRFAAGSGPLSPGFHIAQMGNGTGRHKNSLGFCNSASNKPRTAQSAAYFLRWSPINTVGKLTGSE